VYHSFLVINAQEQLAIYGLRASQAVVFQFCFDMARLKRKKQTNKKSRQQ
jgi:hypothetical protein